MSDENTRRGHRPRRVTIGNLLVIVGALVLLTPLAFFGYNEYMYRQEMAAAAEELSPVVLTPVGEVVEPPEQISLSEGAADQFEPNLPGELQLLQIDRSKGIPVYELEIPKLDLRYKVGEGTENPVLARGPGHYSNTVLPGEEGNAALAGHRTIRGRPAFFYAVDGLEAGDLIYVNYADTRLTYQVERVFLTTAYDLSVLDATPYSALTLTTCDPPGTDERRLIVQAKLVKMTDQ